MRGQSPADGTHSQRTGALSATAPDDTGWNVFSADMVVHYTPGGVLAKAPPSADSSHIVRRLLPDGTWATTITYAPPSILGPRDAINPAKYIGRIEFGGDTTGVRVFDGAGRLIATRNAADLPLAVRQKIGIAGVAAAPASTGAQPDAQSDARGADPRGWITRYVNVPSGAAAARARLISAFGAAPSNLNGRDRYVRTRGSHTDELLVDPSNGAIVEINAADSGRLVLHTTFDFESTEGGPSMLRQIRSEFAHAGSDRHDLLITEVSNIRLATER